MNSSIDDKTLADYRASIDNLNAALIMLLAERFKITKKVGAYKASVGLPAADPVREVEQIARLRELSKTANLDPTFSEKFLRLVIDEVIRHHNLARSDLERSTTDKAAAMDSMSALDKVAADVTLNGG